MYHKTIAITNPRLFFEFSTFVHSELFANATFPWELLTALKPYLQNAQLGFIDGHISPQAYLENPASIIIGKGTVVEPGAYIKGPCIIGEDCIIRHGAYMRGDVITGNGCVIGHATEIKHSILLNNAKAAHFAYLGDTIVGNNVNLGAGVRCANVRFDKQTIHIRFGDELIDTNLNKCGAFIGDNAHIGCNCVLNPGTIVAKNATAIPCSSLKSVVYPHQQYVPQ